MEDTGFPSLLEVLTGPCAERSRKVLALRFSGLGGDHLEGRSHCHSWLVTQTWGLCGQKPHTYPRGLGVGQNPALLHSHPPISQFCGPTNQPQSPFLLSETGVTPPSRQQGHRGLAAVGRLGTCRLGVAGVPGELGRVGRREGGFRMTHP